MADVVQQLKRTPKGRLQYNTNWNPVELQDNTPGRSETFHICPFKIQNNSRLVNVVEQDKSHYSTRDYQNYFTSIKDELQRLNISKTKTKNLRNTTVFSHDHNIIPIERLVIRDNDTEQKELLENTYQLMLEEQSKCRYQKMREDLEVINDQYQEEIDVIEKNQLMRQMCEIDSLQEKEDEIVANMVSEIDDYQSLKEQRNQSTLNNLVNLEKQKKNLEIKIRTRNEERNILNEKKKKLGLLMNSVKDIYSKITDIYEKCKASAAVSQELMVVVSQVAKVYQECTDVISKGVNHSNIDIDACLQLVFSKVDALQTLLEACEKISTDLHERRKAEEKRKQEEAEKAKQAKAAALAAVTTVTSNVLNATITAPVTTSASSNQQLVSIATAVPALAPLEQTLLPILTLCCPTAAFQSYLQLQKHLLDTIKLHEPLSKSTDKATKTYKFDLYKVINTTINAISDESPKHLLDKITKINRLFTGQEVEMSGKKISIKNSKEGLLLCKELLAKKVVLQAPSQVASSFKAAFPIAAFATGIWSLFPEVGELILAHLYLVCPHLVPFYIPKSKHISTLEYCKLVGYDVDGQDVESEDKYLKKLSGMVRLYAAILQTDVPPQLGARNHPHGLEHGWIWLTRLMNLEPRPSVTATIMYDFLETAGSAMFKKYGKQFQKLLLALCSEYLPKIMSVAPKDSKAAEMRLKMFLNDCIKVGKIKEPDGRLTQRWWKTGHA